MAVSGEGDGDGDGGGERFQAIVCSADLTAPPGSLELGPLLQLTTRPGSTVLVRGCAGPTTVTTAPSLSPPHPTSLAASPSLPHPRYLTLATSPLVASLAASPWLPHPCRLTLTASLAASPYLTRYLTLAASPWLPHPTSLAASPYLTRYLTLPHPGCLTIVEAQAAPGAASPPSSCARSSWCAPAAS